VQSRTRARVCPGIIKVRTLRALIAIRNDNHSVLAEAQPAANVAHEKEAQRVLAQHQPQTWIDTAYVAQHAKQDTTLPSTASSLVTRATDEAERAVSSSTDLAALQSQHAFWRQ